MFTQVVSYAMYYHKQVWGKWISFASPSTQPKYLISQGTLEAYTCILSYKNDHKKQMHDEGLKLSYAHGFDVKL